MGSAIVEKLNSAETGSRDETMRRRISGMFILIIGFLFRSEMGPAEFLLSMLGEQKLCATLLLSAALLNVALNIALVPAYGSISGVSATALSLMAAASLNALVVWRRLGIQMPIWNNLPKL